MQTFSQTKLIGQAQVNDASPSGAAASVFLNTPTPPNPWKGKPSKTTDDKLRSLTTIGPDDVHHYRPRRETRPPHDRPRRKPPSTVQQKGGRPTTTIAGADRDSTRNSRHERQDDHRPSTRQLTRSHRASQPESSTTRATPPQFFANPAEKGIRVDRRGDQEHDEVLRPARQPRITKRPNKRRTPQSPTGPYREIRKEIP